jgi:hypothetical protein
MGLSSAAAAAGAVAGAELGDVVVPLDAESLLQAAQVATLSVMVTSQARADMVLRSMGRGL